MSSGSDTISLQEYELLTEQQCPLPPRKFRYINDKNEECSIKTTAWFYKDQFWVKEPTTDKAYPVILQPKELRKYTKRVNRMRAVDAYIGSFGLTTSVHIYKMLTISMDKDALTPRTSAALSNVKIPTNASLYAKKFTPTWSNRLGFLTVIFRAILNAYFILTNFINIPNVPLNYRIFVAVVVGIEALIWLIAFTRSMYNVRALLKRLCKGDTTHFQVKNLPENLRQLASISVMRYLPNGEGMSMLKKRRKEWVSERKSHYAFEVSNARKCKVCVKVRWLILTILDVIGPFVAVFSLLFKMAQLNFQFDALDEWNWVEIIGYFAFVNQVAGIRKVRKIEIDALQHFIFSGSDTQLSQEEHLLLEIWYNYTIVSCVANICNEFKYPVYDSIIFWYNLNVRRIQLLFKDHKGMEGDEFIGKNRKVKINPDSYDNKIQLQIKNNTAGNGTHQIVTQQSTLTDEEYIGDEQEKDFKMVNNKNNKSEQEYSDVPVEEPQEQKDEEVTNVDGNVED